MRFLPKVKQPSLFAVLTNAQGQKHGCALGCLPILAGLMLVWWLSH